MREQQIYERLYRLGCSQVLDVVDFVRDDEHIGLITEFADGGDLANYVNNNKDFLSTRDTKAIATSLAGGLSQLHSQGIVHRDLKPENILCTNGVWKLADFGIAKSLSRLHTQHTFQQAGTPGYAPPEQFDGVEAHSSADIYALGKLLAFMLTGQTDPDRIAQSPWRVLARECTKYDPPKRPTIDVVNQRLEQIMV